MRIDGYIRTNHRPRRRSVTLRVTMKPLSKLPLYNDITCVHVHTRVNGKRRSGE
ncbi:hypothetical protein ALC56_12321 [Trachymyrmex septentrionalis]|uniref:Uncharacterized protein n=1 Tax=Trachymyrmex septentrionalis TaxID=34720 RepID=A0A195F0G5_9HYME|nr:hypothetical protein ALC56_12321 [Trachymyrmex septentrionalis]